MNPPVFIILYADEQTYFGKQSYFDSGWKDIEDKPIKKVFFRMPTGDYMVLSNYEKYYHYMEATKIVAGDNAGKVQLEYLHMLGKRQNQVIEYKVRVLTGDIKINVFDAENEYIKKLNPIGWRG